MKIKLSLPCVTAEQVDAERDRRLEAGFLFGGVKYQARERDIANFNGAATLAGMAIAAGALPGDLRWADPEEDFRWIAADNSKTPMDAYTLIALGKAAFAFVQKVTFTARNMKDRLIAGEYIKDAVSDELWPS